MTLTTTTQIGSPVDATFQRMALEISKANCPAFAGTTPAVITANQGNNFTARWRRYENFDAAAVAAAPLSELTGALSYPTRQPVQASITTLETTLKKYGMFITTTEDVDLQQYSSEHNGGLAKSIGVCAGRTLNLLQIKEEEDNSTQYFSGGVANDAAVVSYLGANDVEYATNWLERNNARSFFNILPGADVFATSPINKTYIALTHPDVIADVRSHPNWKSVEVYAGQTSVYTGEEGTTNRVRWVSTTDSTIVADDGGAAASNGRDSRALRSTTGTAADIYNTVIYGEDAFGSVGLNNAFLKSVYTAGDQIPGVLIINLPRGYDKVDPFGELQMMGFKTWHAAKVLSELDAASDTRWCLNIRAGATSL